MDSRLTHVAKVFEKVWRMIVHVAGAEAGRAEWFVKVDADTWLFPEHVGRVAEAWGWRHDEPHYFGHVLHHRESDRGVAIGAWRGRARGI